MENLQINQGIKFLVSDGKGVIGTADPSGSQGISKTAGHTGFYIQSSVDYTLNFYDGSSWSAYQSIDVSDANYTGGFAFAWDDNTAAYIKTADASHVVYVFGRDGDLKVDSTPGDATQAADSIVDGSGSLSITSIDAQNDYTEGLSVASDGTVTFDRTDNNAAYQLKFSGSGITIGKNGDDTVTFTGADEFTTPLTTDGDLFIQSGSADARLAIGTDGQYLSVASGAPAWADLTSLSIGSAQQIPFMNDGATDLSYDAKLTFTDGNNASLNIDRYGYGDAIKLGDTHASNVANYCNITNYGKIAGKYYAVETEITPSNSNFGIKTKSNHPMYLLTNNTVNNVSMFTNGNVSISTATDLSASLGVKGEGSTSATSAFLVKNSSNSTLFEIKDDGTVQANGSSLLSAHSSGALSLMTSSSSSIQNTFGGSIYHGTVLVAGYSVKLNGGARSSIIAGGSHDIDPYADNAFVAGNFNKSKGHTDSTLGTGDNSFKYSSMIGQANTVNGTGMHAIGSSNLIYGRNYTPDGNFAIGYGNIIGETAKHARQGYAFGHTHNMRNSARRVMSLGYGVDTYYFNGKPDTQSIIAFGTTSAGSTRPSMAIYPDPNNLTKAPNFVLGGNNIGRWGTTYPNQNGIGSGCIIFHNNGSDTVMPSVNVPDSVSLFIADSVNSVGNTFSGSKGLIIKGELDGMSIFSQRIGVNVTKDATKTSQINEELQAGLHIFGEGNSDATSAVKVENSDGDIAIEVLNDLVVVMPNLPTSSAGLPTGALYNDGGTVKVA